MQGITDDSPVGSTEETPSASRVDWLEIQGQGGMGCKDSTWYRPQPGERSSIRTLRSFQSKFRILHPSASHATWLESATAAPSCTNHVHLTGVQQGVLPGALKSIDNYQQLLFASKAQG